MATLGLAAGQRVAVRDVCLEMNIRLGYANAGSLSVGDQRRLPLMPQGEHSRQIQFPTMARRGRPDGVANNRMRAESGCSLQQRFDFLIRAENRVICDLP